MVVLPLAGELGMMYVLFEEDATELLVIGVSPLLTAADDGLGVLDDQAGSEAGDCAVDDPGKSPKIEVDD